MPLELGVSGTLDVAVELASGIGKSIRHCSKSRYHIAADMSEKLQKDITKTMLDNWSGESHDAHRIPAEYLPALCHATKSTLLMEILAESLDGCFATGKQKMYLELAMAEMKRDRLDKRILELKTQL